MAFDLDNEELNATRKLHGINDDLYEDKKSEDNKEIDTLIEAKRKLKEDYDTEAAKTIIEMCLLGPWAITGGRVNYIKLALKVLLAELEQDKKKIQELEEENKENKKKYLALLLSQFPDTTETYKKYKKELEELLEGEK